ncbi:MAG: formamidopyrimidine-DNA glycosylase [Planctomycetaceae bacterium]|jgi:formamidopyrimidine-DNA glycosylase|nr:formamidopyrimidine-DNA glycosylase [Planctomycetaceae bacterium]
MPELPEVETMRRGILAVVGSRIQAVEKLRTSLKPILVRPGLAVLNKRVQGQGIVAVERIGKRVIVRLESADRLIFEPRMTGLVLVADPPNYEHLRVEVSLTGGKIPKLLYWDRRGLGSVQLLSPKQFESRIVAKLGPDALVVTPDELRTRLGKSRRAVKVALLDQKAVSGIGNLYASEILNLSGIHPAKRCDQLSRGAWQCIQAATLKVLQDAIRYEGSTLSDGTYRNALNDAGGYQNQHRVYDRAGETCRACGDGIVQRIIQAQRSTFFCPLCQRKRGKPRHGV